MPHAIHHSVILVRDMERSVQFYRDGIGLEVLVDREVEADYPALLEGPSRHLRVVFLGDRSLPDVNAGVLELAMFPGGHVVAGPIGRPPAAGLFMLSFFVNVEETLGRLANLGLGGAPRQIVQSTPSGPMGIATVRDPDGVVVLLTSGSTTQAQPIHPLR
jgi:catechol 2,3-dioxygenase-like lactoylglutathione lyase family enzyme